MVQLRVLPVIAAALVLAAAGDPAFLRRSLAEARPHADDLTADAPGASYKPLFGAGDADVRRFHRLGIQARRAVAALR